MTTVTILCPLVEQSVIYSITQFKSIGNDLWSHRPGLLWCSRHGSLCSDDGLLLLQNDLVCATLFFWG